MQNLNPLDSLKARSRRSWRWWIAAVGCVLIGAGVSYKYYWLDRPVGAGPAGPSVAREKFQAAWTTRPVLLLGLGDSMTAGFGATPGCSYFERLATNPPGEFADMRGICLSAVLPNLRVENLAVSGSTSLDHFNRHLAGIPLCPTNTWGIAVMTTGGNDLIHDYGMAPPREGAMYGASLAQAAPWIAAFRLRLDAMIQRINKCFPGGCDIFLADIYDPTDGVGDIERAGLPAWKDGLAIHAAYNEVIAQCAAHSTNVHLVRVHAAFLGHGIHCRQFWRDCYRREDPYYWYFANLEDPNDRGYDALRRLFLNEIQKVADQIK
jgi:hypothetical protein